jgi:hypothetical protein
MPLRHELRTVCSKRLQRRLIDRPVHLQPLRYITSAEAVPDREKPQGAEDELGRLA